MWKCCALLCFAAAFASPAAAQVQILVLQDSDAQAYAKAFDAADANAVDTMENALANIQDRILISDVEARLLLAVNAKPKRVAFASWLSAHGDHREARAVARRGQSLGYRGLPQPTPARGRAFPYAAQKNLPQSSAHQAAIEAIAMAFGEGDIAHALTLAQAALAGPRSGQAAWWLGLIAWRQGEFSAAAQWFSAAATWPSHDAWARAGAHFWAARAHLASGQGQAAITHLRQAAAWPATFYGQLAGTQLGQASPLDFSTPPLTAQALSDTLNRYPAARRAAALAQLGWLSEVERELTLLHAQVSPDEDRAILALAIALAAPGAQLRIAEYGAANVAAGYCPATTFAPEDGFRLDRALILAIVRQESRFSPIAISNSNARGLMQLLPSTAHDMDKSHAFPRAPAKLHEPGLNLRVGQQYVEWLDQTFKKNGDLSRIFAAYNGGPGWLSRWEQRVGRHDDPLMMLESLPRTEARDYAERVLSHFALCRKRFGQPDVEFVSLANGAAPLYRGLDR